MFEGVTLWDEITIDAMLRTLRPDLDLRNDSLTIKVSALSTALWHTVYPGESIHCKIYD